MANAKQLIDAMNSTDVRIFPQKNDSKKFTISMEVEGKRFFITRVATADVNDDGTANYIWARGVEMRKIGE